ncbi:hypothetical protein QJQ45_008334 [Haematococcus lacustris]|nr:hypothetical protein QJQ45_008334 [Haematococcus lacustris]
MEDTRTHTPAHGEALSHPPASDAAPGMPNAHLHPMQCGLDTSQAKPLEAQVTQAKLVPDVAVTDPPRQGDALQPL